jgi:hypothetical protein
VTPLIDTKWHGSTASGRLQLPGRPRRRRIGAAGAAAAPLALAAAPVTDFSGYCILAHMK